MGLGAGITQAVIDALPYSSAAAAFTYLAGSSTFSATLAITFAATVWLALFLVLWIVSLNRYRADETWLPITRAFVYHTFVFWP